MKNKPIIFVAILLVISVGNYMKIIGVGNVRPVEFLSIFVLGALSGILLYLLIQKVREGKR